MTDDPDHELDKAALAYHRADPPGKLAIQPTKPLATQRDLSLAYSPGVAAACLAIRDEPDTNLELTSRGNLVAVISNGTAVLGLGNIGALAGKPVMEGKAALFKKFAGIDVFDIEIDENDPGMLIETIARLEPTFGGINLEDIKAPECFEVEARLRERMKIPVFHDDQHGTAIVASAAILNALELVDKKIEDVRLVACGAGAAALACLDLLVSLGLTKANITVCDIVGVVFEGRTEQMDPYKARYAVDTPDRTLADAVDGADVFLGLSAANVLKPAMVKTMARDPLILAMANPDPEIRPELAREARPDAIICTGRSDFPNQVNNVLCFPFIFRGALDVGATTINEPMKHACVRAIAALARAGVSEMVANAYSGAPLRFGRDYILPKPFDDRLILEVAPAVAKAAMESGVARRPIEDFEAYDQKLSRFVFRSGNLMRPIFEAAQSNPRRLLFARGDSERVLYTVQQVLAERIARPVLLGNPDAIAEKARSVGLKLPLGAEIEIIDPATIAADSELVERLYERHWRQGMSPSDPLPMLQTDATALSCILLECGDVDAAIVGPVPRFYGELRTVERIIGRARGVRDLSTLNALILPSGTYFVCDTYVSDEPTAQELAELGRLAAEEVRRFGIEPRIAFLSASNFGSRNTPGAKRVRAAVALLKAEQPDLMVDGEMHGDVALSEALRQREFPRATLAGEANLWIMPNLDAANIAFNLLKQLGGGVSVGPILLGAAKPIHIATRSLTTRGLLNLAAIAVVEAQLQSSDAE